MTRRAAPDRTRLFAALSALRAASDPSASTLGWAWRDLSDWLDTRRRLPDREHDDVRQRTLLKVLRGVATMSAETEGQADGWLKRVWQSARLEHHRSKGTRIVDDALRSAPPDGDPGWIDRTVAAPEDERTEEDGARLYEVLSRALDRVHGWLAAHVDRAAKREGDYRRAQMALMVNVLGMTVDEVRARSGVPAETSKAAVYKWIERGREEVLLPALEGWDDPAQGPLLDVLTSSRRADAGRPRPTRRSPGAGAVSSRAADASKKRKAKKRADSRSKRRDIASEEKDR